MGTSVIASIKARLPYRLKDAIRPPYPEAARRWVGGSFSQTGEDIVVSFIFGELGIERPSYLDIGAYHPFHISNTALMNLRGSRGVNIEPDPEAFTAFTKYRQEDVNLNIGCSDSPGTLTFYRMSAPTLHTFSKEAADEVTRQSEGRIRIEDTQQVEVRTVASILREQNRDCPDFLSLDVEGLDLSILKTMPTWPCGGPVVVCVETISYSETGHGQKISEIGDLLGGYGYMPFADTHHNTIFVLRDRWIRSRA